MKILPNEAITHNGRFHTDDVFSAALLKILNPNIIIKRLPNAPEDFSGLVFDLSTGEYDHHSPTLKYRDNKIPYASFGLLWKEFGSSLVGEDAAKTFDESFVQLLDLQDNTGGNNLLCRAITQGNPKWDSNDSPDECFFKAVDFAMYVLTNEIDSMRSTEKASSIVKNALLEQKNNIVILPIGVPWKSILVPEPILFVIYPSTRGGYNAQAVPINISSQECKLYFPSEWRGQTTCLESISNISGLTFCHTSGYILSANTIGAAVSACLKTIENAS
ncbi:MAG: MYG1 family protein [Suipraeoptans sp.]